MAKGKKIKWTVIGVIADQARSIRMTVSAVDLEQAQKEADKYNFKEILSIEKKQKYVADTHKRMQEVQAELRESKIRETGKATFRAKSKQEGRKTFYG